MLPATIEEFAKVSAGNWQQFVSFAWLRDQELEDADQWAVIYTHHRDSGLLDQSNVSVMNAAMQVFTDGDDPDVVFESHSHWAVGHIDGFSVRVFRDSGITEAFKVYHNLAVKKDEYPILDEENYSKLEYEATIRNIVDAAYSLKHEYELPEEWEYAVYSWLSEEDAEEIENQDDQGGYPSDDALRQAFDALKFTPIEE